MALGLKCNTVVLVEHDPEWEIIAVHTIERLWRIFNSIAKDIQHIGSTSISGLKAKPSIGIVIAIEKFEQIIPLIPLMEQDGFFITCQMKEDEWKIIVYEDQTYAVETHCIIIVKSDNPRYKELLYFRDYLNANPEAAKRYEAIKIDAAKKSNNDRVVYKKNKSAFMKQILEEALSWVLGL